VVQHEFPHGGRAFPGPAALTLASVLAVLLAVLAVFALTRSASAASEATPARATLTLSGSAAKTLTKAGVKVTAARKATVRKTTVTLPVSVSVVGSSAAVGLNGTITFRSGKRTATLTGLRVMVSKKRAVQVLARAGGDQFAVLTGTVTKKALTLNAFNSTAAFAGTSVKLTKRAGTLLRTKLRLRRAPSGTLGKLTLSAPKTSGTGTTTTGTTTVITNPDGTTTTTKTGTTGTTTTGTTTTPGTTTTTPIPGTGPKVCTATAPANSAVSEPDFDSPKPLNAVDLQSACITWHPRDSWIDYTNSGPDAGDGATLTNGATADAANTACGALLKRDFHFQFHRGWFDPATGNAVLQYVGTVRFRYQQHGIDIGFQNPEVQIAGGASQTTFRRVAGPGGRLAVLSLDASGPLKSQCKADPGPKNSHDPTGVSGPRTYERLHATVSPDAAPLFDSGGQGGAYPPGDDFGWLSISFSPAS